MEILIDVKKPLDACFKQFEEVIPKDSKNRVNKIRRHAAQLYLRNISSDDKDLKRALLFAVGDGTKGAQIGVSHTVNPKAGIVSVLRERVTMTGLECYKEFKKGTEGMREVLKYAVRGVKPEERTWISYDLDNDTYIVESVGAAVPDDWKGYSPIESAE